MLRKTKYTEAILCNEHDILPSIEEYNSMEEYEAIIIERSWKIFQQTNDYNSKKEYVAFINSDNGGMVNFNELI